MTTKRLLIAASALAPAACGGAETETAETESEDGAATTALAEEQPTLEGDSPFVDGDDVADSTLEQERYDNGLNGPDLTGDGDVADDEFAEAEPEFDDATNNLIAESERIAADARAEAAAAGDDAQRYAANAGQEAERVAQDAERRAGEVAGSIKDSLSAERYTANETDAVIGPDGELITGSEAALLAGEWEITVPGQNVSTALVIDGRGNTATGSFGGTPVEVAVTGRNFSFDAPLTVDGEEELMTFAGTFEGDRIENGVVSAQGDGGSMTFTGVRLGDDGASERSPTDEDGIQDTSEDPNFEM